MPVIYTRHALDQAERYSRAGYAVGAESGCMLLGRLCISPDPACCYLVIMDALQIQEAQQQPYSLALTPASWMNLEKQLAARAGERLKIVGMAHGHNFLPEPGCETCPSKDRCRQHTAFFSTEDRRFFQSVFPLQRHPFQVAHVFGLDVHAAPRDALWQVDDGQRKLTPYRIIERLPQPFLSNHIKKEHAQ